MWRAALTACMASFDAPALRAALAEMSQSDGGPASTGVKRRTAGGGCPPDLPLRTRCREGPRHRGGARHSVRVRPNPALHCIGDAGEEGQKMTIFTPMARRISSSGSAAHCGNVATSCAMFPTVAGVVVYSTWSGFSGRAWRSDCPRVAVVVHAVAHQHAGGRVGIAGQQGIDSSPSLAPWPSARSGGGRRVRRAGRLWVREGRGNGRRAAAVRTCPSSFGPSLTCT